ncbi:MAG: preprotein translocase subunit YajC [Candidatus Coproplasma sp.]
MILSLLETSSSTSGNSQWLTYVMLGVLVVLLIVMFVVSSRRNKKRQQEAEQLINSVKPGNKVKTIGGVCGIVVEVNDEESTFVLETGSESSGKCYMKFDKQAIYQTDAVVDDKKAASEEQSESVEEPAQEEAKSVQEEAKPAESSEETTEEKKD